MSALGIDACAHVLTCARMFLLCARGYEIFTKKHLVVKYFVISLSLKFHKDPSFSCGDICKIIIIVWVHSFTCINGINFCSEGGSEEFCEGYSKLGMIYNRFFSGKLRYCNDFSSQNFQIFDLWCSYIWIYLCYTEVV